MNTNKVTPNRVYILMKFVEYESSDILGIYATKAAAEKERQRRQDAAKVKLWIRDVIYEVYEKEVIE